MLSTRAVRTRCCTSNKQFQAVLSTQLPKSLLEPFSRFLEPVSFSFGLILISLLEPFSALFISTLLLVSFLEPLFPTKSSAKWHLIIGIETVHVHASATCYSASVIVRSNAATTLPVRHFVATATTHACRFHDAFSHFPRPSSPGFATRQGVQGEGKQKYNTDHFHNRNS